MNYPALVLSFVSLLAFGIADNVRGPLFGEILREFSLSDAMGSWIFATSSLMAFFFSMLGGWSLKRLSFLGLMQISLVGLSLGLALFALAESFFAILVGAVIFGGSLGLLGVCQNSLVSVASIPEKRAQWFSGFHAMYGVSSFLAPLIVAGTADMLVSSVWRASFWIAAAFPALVVGFSFFFRRVPLLTNKAHHSFSESSETRAAHPGLQYLLAMAFGLYVVGEILISTRLTLYFNRELGRSLEESSWMLSLFFVFLLLGRGLVSFVKLPLSLFTQLLLSLGGSGLFVALGLLVEPWFLVVSGFVMAPFYGFLLTYLGEVFPQSRGEATSKAMALQSLLVFAMHLGAGKMSDLWGLKIALWLGPVAFILAGFFLVKVHYDFKRR